MVDHAAVGSRWGRRTFPPSVGNVRPYTSVAAGATEPQPAVATEVHRRLLGAATAKRPPARVTFRNPGPGVVEGGVDGQGIGQRLGAVKYENSLVAVRHFSAPSTPTRSVSPCE